MFLTTALKDYIDQLNDLSLSLNDNFTLFTVFKYSLFYILDSIKLFFVYILSFQWLTLLNYVISRLIIVLFFDGRVFNNNFRNKNRA
jgi:hypothetical protein